MIGENNSGPNVSQGDLQYWANTFGLTHPVVADPGFDVTAQYLFADPNFSGSFGLPNMQLLSPGMIVERSNTWIDQSDFMPYLD